MLRVLQTKEWFRVYVLDLLEKEFVSCKDLTKQHGDEV